MAYDGTLHLVDSVHLQPEDDGGALVVDDRTLSVAHVNKAAHVVLNALREPRTREELAAILADAAHCASAEAVAPVDRLVVRLTDYGWVEPDPA
ncbi:hypothetical protein OK074_5551 [Actinobacteria bacterium OK074]|nr:hypothetical protein OK074_5551 [Actinobacteria bacterium OK074]